MCTDYNFSELNNLKKINLAHLRNKTIVVTGATGLIGRALVSCFEYLSKVHELNINIIKVSKSCNQNECSGYVSWDEFPDKFDFLIHAGAPTASSYFANNPVETFSEILHKTEICLTKQLKNSNCKSVFLSTIEVYGEGDGNILRECELKSINIDNPRSSYPLGKRCSEFLIKAYTKQYGVHSSIARLTQTFGTGVQWHDQRVFAYFGRCLLEQKDIVLATEGLLKRPYLDILDAITGIVYILLYGKDGESYNLSNPMNYVSIKELAQKFIDKSKKIHCRSERDPDMAKKFAPQSGINLSVDKIQGLGWTPERTLDRTIDDLLNSLKVTR